MRQQGQINISYAGLQVHLKCKSLELRASTIRLGLTFIRSARGGGGGVHHREGKVRVERGGGSGYTLIAGEGRV
jgi:hypothetical protein